MRNNVIAIVILLLLIGWGIYDFTKSDTTETLADSSMEERSDVEVGTERGKQAPDFQLQDTSGQSVQLSDYRGQKIILNFWATWCPPCRAEMPHMEKVYNEHEDAVVLGVNLTHTEKNSGDIDAFVQDFGLTFPIVFDSEGDVSDIYRVTAYPTTYMIDQNGIIHEIYMGAINEEIMNRSLATMAR
ncbi:TlpA family protein disulfide reductase [Paenibacillus chungangensis]|uniref:TlpA family protein disulfide reductase n=1 Tax=Paenibacillus chungangensis TaxID=696535 RepID=A0ABW3HN01_9BACL